MKLCTIQTPWSRFLAEPKAIQLLPPTFSRYGFVIFAKARTSKGLLGFLSIYFEIPSPRIQISLRSFLWIG
jgi:hypothetical protein